MCQCAHSLESEVEYGDMHDLIRLPFEYQSAAVRKGSSSRVKVSRSTSMLLRNHLITRREFWRRCCKVGWSFSMNWLKFKGHCGRCEGGGDAFNKGQRRREAVIIEWRNLITGIKFQQ